MKKITTAGLLSLLLLALMPIAGFLFTKTAFASPDETDAPLVTQEICSSNPIPPGFVIVDARAEGFRCGVVYNPGNIYNVYIIENISGYYVGTVVPMCDWAAFPTNEWVIIERQAVNYRCGVAQQPPGPGGGQVINLKYIKRVIGPTPTPVPTAVPGRPPIGYLDSVNSTTRIAKGWSLDPDNPQANNTVHIYINGPAGNTQGSGTFIGAVVANLYRPDVNSGTNYPGNHGFEFTVPVQYCDGTDHPIYAYGLDTGPNGSKLLTDSPRTLNCSPPNTTRRTMFDYNGDGKADVTVVRDGGNWYSLLSPNNTFSATSFGQPGDLVVPGDYDGDGKTDIAVSRAQSGARYFYIILSSSSQFYGIQFGLTVDVPVVGDYDGDGKTDLAVWRPGNGNGVWHILNSASNQTTSTQFGYATDTPIPGDYDGDGKTDIAVNRRTNGALNWYIQRSALGFTGYGYGLDTDAAVPADYDGDGKTDAAVFRSGNWYIQRSALGVTSVGFGQTGDIPVQADYDGDGKTDVAVFRGENGAGNFYMINSATNQINGAQWGLASDNPIGGTYPR